MIKPLFQRLFEAVRDDLGSPASLQRLIRERPQLRVRLDARPQVIATENVVRWEDFGGSYGAHWPRTGSGKLRGWKMRGGQYSSCEHEVPALSELTVTQTDENFSCDIGEVTGLAASKSELLSYLSIADMAEACCEGLIQDKSIAGLEKNLSWPEVRIARGSKSDFFMKYGWDDGMYLINSGGSHHFVAAHYQAQELDHPVSLEGRLVEITINKLALWALSKEYAVYAISDEDHMSLDFQKAMQAFKAEYYWKDLPRPYANCRAIFLPRSESRSMKVAALLDAEQFQDVTALLARHHAPDATKLRAAEQDEIQLRISKLAGLLRGAGPALVFGQHAANATCQAPVATVNWQEIERLTIRECLYEHNQDPESVFKVLYEFSPGITNEQAARSAYHTVLGYHALRVPQLECSADASNAPNI